MLDREDAIGKLEFTIFSYLLLSDTHVWLSCVVNQVVAFTAVKEDESKSGPRTTCPKPWHRRNHPATVVLTIL